MPFVYNDDGLNELIIEANLEDVSVGHLYRLIFESLLDRKQLKVVFETSLQIKPTTTKDNMMVFIECMHIHRRMNALMGMFNLSNKHNKGIPPVLVRYDKTSILALLH
jgi:hypothetical protein